MNVYDVIRRPLITEKGHVKREAESTLCFEVHKEANKIEIKQAVETVFKVKVSEVRTSVIRRQIAPPGPFYRLRIGLEKGLCPLGAGAEIARVHRNLIEEARRHAYKKFSPHNANAALPNVRDARGYHQGSS